MSIISGKQFKEQYPNNILYKYTNQKSCHNGFQYQEGINEDHITLTTRFCSPGGLYFANIDNEEFYRWIYPDSVWVWDVTIPDDAQVVIEPKAKAKSDKIILSNKRSIHEMKEWNNPDIHQSAILMNPSSIRFVDAPSEKLQLDAVNQNGWSIQYIKDPTNVVKLAAIQESAEAFKYIKNPSEEMKLAAIRQSGYIIQYIDNPSEEIKLIAVTQYGSYIRFIKDPSEAIQLVAVQQSGISIQFIQNPSEEIKLVAVHQNGCAIQYIQNPSEEMKLAAVKQDGYSIRFIQNVSEELKTLALKHQHSLYIPIINSTTGMIMNPQ